MSGVDLASSGFLVHSLEDENEAVRLAGLQCLSQPFYLSPCQELLLHALYDPSQRVRIAALQGVERLYAEHPQSKLLLSSDRVDVFHCLVEVDVQRTAFRCLSKAAQMISAEEVFPWICRALDADAELLDSALALAAALGRSGKSLAFTDRHMPENTHRIRVLYL